MWLSSHIIIIIIIIIIASEGITQVATLSLHLSYPLYSLYSLSAKHFPNRPAHPMKLYVYVVVIANYHIWCYSPPPE